MVESTEKTIKRSASGRAIETFKDISPRRRRELDEMTEEQLAAVRAKKQEEEEKQ